MAEIQNFDIDEVVKLSFKYDTLKNVLNYLLRRDKYGNERLNKMEIELSSTKKALAE